MMPKLVGNRIWEPKVTALVASLVKPGMTFIDVGANFGYYTCLAGTLMGPTEGSRVFAIEPQPDLANLIVRNSYVNWSMAPIEVINVAIADRFGTRTLHVPSGLTSQASLTKPTRGLDRSGRRPPELVPIAVEVETLDNLFPDPITADVVKIDVEGEELGVLTGARELIKRSSNIEIVMEWSLDHLARAQGRAEALVNLIGQLGFKAHHIEAKREMISSEGILALDYGNLWLRRN
ncbi:MAG: FkbM family methyltransferase [Proteobacteria bacterium]|nr:FkbM family methyltransferase [Pseudomonadota bacterium]